MSRANSLKKAVRQLVEYMEGAIDQQNAQGLGVPHNEPSLMSESTTKYTLEVPTISKALENMKVAFVDGYLSVFANRGYKCDVFPCCRQCR